MIMSVCLAVLIVLICMFNKSWSETSKINHALKITEWFLIQYGVPILSFLKHYRFLKFYFLIAKYLWILS